METFNEDSKAILRASGVNISLFHLNRRKSGKNEEGSMKEVKHLLAGVSQQALHYIVNKYRRDFLLCGYNQTLDMLEGMLEKDLHPENPHHD